MKCGVKSRRTGYITNNGSWLVVFLPYVPRPRFFLLRCPTLSLWVWRRRILPVFVEEILRKQVIPIEEEECRKRRSNKRPLKEFADEQNLKMPTLRKIIYLLTEQGSSLNPDWPHAILVDPFQKALSWNPQLNLKRRTRSYQKQLKRHCSSWARDKGRRSLTQRTITPDDSLNQVF